VGGKGGGGGRGEKWTKPCMHIWIKKKKKSTWKRKACSLGLQIPPGSTMPSLYFPFLTFNKPHLYPRVLEWILPEGHKEFGSLLITDAPALFTILEHTPMRTSHCTALFFPKLIYTNNFFQSWCPTTPDQQYFFSFLFFFIVVLGEDTLWHLQKFSQFHPVKLQPARWAWHIICSGGTHVVQHSWWADCVHPGPNWWLNTTEALWEGYAALASG
jgi:hypothetical protein